MRSRILIIFFVLSGLSFNGFGQAVQYSFFVAGHTYGYPGVDNEGLHPPFVAKFPYIKSRSEIELGFLTGDIVKESTTQDWIEVDADIEALGLPVYFAVGNHDMKNRDFYESRYGSTYHSFIQNEDLFIILDPNIDHWNISGDQLTFLQSTINENASKVHNIFVFFHQMLWWSNDNKYANLVSNSYFDRADEINFWTEIEPIFHGITNHVVMFAGDVGATSVAIKAFYDTYDNITFIASGMGSLNGDNFVVVNVLEDKTLEYDLICLNGQDINCLGSLINHSLGSRSNDFAISSSIHIFPNPTTGLITIDHLSHPYADFTLYNLTGVEMHRTKLGINTTQIQLPKLKKGLYIAKIQSKSDIFTSRILVN